MKNNTNTTTKTTNKTNSKNSKQKEVAKTQSCRVMESGLDRDILMNSLLVVSVLINVFFLAGYMLVASDGESARAVATMIYNL